MKHICFDHLINLITYLKIVVYDRRLLAMHMVNGRACLVKDRDDLVDRNLTLMLSQHIN